MTGAGGAQATSLSLLWHQFLGPTAALVSPTIHRCSGPPRARSPHAAPGIWGTQGVRKSHVPEASQKLNIGWEAQCQSRQDRPPGSSLEFLVPAMLPTSHPSEPHIVLVTSVKGHQINCQLQTWVAPLPSPQFLEAEPFPLPPSISHSSHSVQFQEAGQALLPGAAQILFVQIREETTSVTSDLASVN